MGLRIVPARWTALRYRLGAGSLSFRLSLITLFGCTAILALALTGSARQTNPATASWAWLMAIVVSVWCGMLTLRTARLAGRIEGELLQAGKDRRGWQAARPLLDGGRAARTWNDLLERAARQELFAGNAPGADEAAAEEVLLHRAVRSMPLGFAISDSAGAIRRANPAWAAIFQREDAESVVGTTVDELLDLAAVPGGEHLASRLQRRTRSVTVQLQRGETLHDGVLRISRTRMGGRDGDGDGVLWTVQDVTQQMLAVHARDQFLLTATHELRTPLANIKAYAEALGVEQGVNVEEQKEFCNIINDETTRLGRLVDQLLAVSQMEAGAMVLARGDVDVNRLIRDAVEYVRPQAEGKGQRLEQKVSPQLPAIRGDKDKLHAVLVNLLGNAVKYTPEGGLVQLEVSGESGRLEVQVEDTGVGIAEENLEKVFDKFFRCEDAVASEEPGNGLGLAFAREVARLHGGDIAAESRLGEGSRFTLWLPPADAPPPAG